MSLPDCSRQMDLNYKYYFPELFPRAFRCGRSTARTSGMGPSPCLKGTSGLEANSSAVRCHSRTLQKEGQPTSRVSDFYQLLEKKSLHLWRMPVITCPWGLCCEGEHSWESWSQLWAVHGAGGLEGWRAQREGDPQHSATCQIEGQKQVDVKLGTMGPSQRPFSSRPILSWMVHQGWRIGCLRWAESLTSSLYTILNPVVSQDLLCELLTWPLPPSARKSAPSMSGSYNSYFRPCYFGNFGFLFFCF